MSEGANAVQSCEYEEWNGSEQSSYVRGEGETIVIEGRLLHLSSSVLQKGDLEMQVFVIHRAK